MKQQANLFVIVPPGVTADMVEVEANVQKIDFNFAEKSEQEMIDNMALVNSQQAALEKWLKTAKEVMKARLVAPALAGEFTRATGTNFEVNYWKKERTDVDRQAIIAEMGEEWYANHCKTTEYYELRFSPKSA